MSHPLLCWDIYLDAKQRRIDLAVELDTINNIKFQNNWRLTDSFVENALIWENSTIVITNLNAQIVFASENILNMTGYYAKEVIGEKPTLFQGPLTETLQKEMIKKAIANQIAFNTVITNYKKDGTTYKCQIEGFPMFNHNGKLINFVAIEKAA